MLSWETNILDFTQPSVMLTITAGYLASTLGMKHHMRNRKAYDLKFAMQTYNILQVILNLYMIQGLYKLPWMSKTPNLFAINTFYSKDIQYYVLVHYLSKYLDFFDTYFMILRKKNNQLSFLHVYHHATIGLIWGGLLHVGHGNGTAAFGCLINSVIHTIMYSHYWYTALGYNNPFKKLITQAQMLQFFLCIVHSVSVLIWEYVYPREIAWIQFIYHIQMIVLFRNFYKKNYKRLNIE